MRIILSRRKHVPNTHLIIINLKSWKEVERVGWKLVRSRRGSESPFIRKDSHWPHYLLYQQLLSSSKSQFLSQRISSDASFWWPLLHYFASEALLLYGPSLAFVITYLHILSCYMSCVCIYNLHQWQWNIIDGRSSTQRHRERGKGRQS